MNLLTGLDLRERAFFNPDLLASSYFRRKREEHLHAQEVRLANPLRDYPTLLSALTEIHEHREDHAWSYIKRLRDQEGDYESCEAVFAEVIVYVGCLKQ